MDRPIEREVHKPVDGIQQRLADYACRLNYEDLSLETIHAAKVRIIDTLGALIAGFFGEPCQIARNLAAAVPDAAGASVIGTRMKTTPDLAAFVNATTARYVELTDTYHWPGSFGGHPSDVVMPVLAAAEHAQATGRDFISGVVLAYEVFCRFSDVFHNPGFDNTNFSCLATAVASGKLLRLSRDQLSHGIAMAAVPNVILKQVRKGQLSMFKGVAAGQAGRAGVFAALLARHGMEGPHLPFEGKAGWCDHVARERFSLDTMGGEGVPFKILDTRVKNRSCNGVAIASVLAAEKVAPLKGIGEVRQVTVEVHHHAKQGGGNPDQNAWTPDSREAADHSIPYLTAATLLEGTVTPRSYDDAHLWNPALRALMQKVEVIENEEFTRAYERLPQQHRTRITVIMSDGQRFIGEAGGDEDDLATPKSDAQIEAKFRSLTEDFLGVKQVNAALHDLWHLEDVKETGSILPPFLLA